MRGIVRFFGTAFFYTGDKWISPKMLGRHIKDCHLFSSDYRSEKPSGKLEPVLCVTAGQESPLTSPGAFYKNSDG